MDLTSQHLRQVINNNCFQNILLISLNYSYFPVLHPYAPTKQYEHTHTPAAFLSIYVNFLRLYNSDKQTTTMTTNHLSLSRFTSILIPIKKKHNTVGVPGMCIELAGLCRERAGKQSVNLISSSQLEVQCSREDGARPSALNTPGLELRLSRFLAG